MKCIKEWEVFWSWVQTCTHGKVCTYVTQGFLHCLLLPFQSQLCVKCKFGIIGTHRGVSAKCERHKEQTPFSHSLISKCEFPSLDFCANWGSSQCPVHDDATRGCSRRTCKNVPKTHKIIELGRDLWELPDSTLIKDVSTRTGCLGLYPVRFLISSYAET